MSVLEYEYLFPTREPSEGTTGRTRALVPREKNGKLGKEDRQSRKPGQDIRWGGRAEQPIRRCRRLDRLSWSCRLLAAGPLSDSVIRREAGKLGTGWLRAGLAGLAGLGSLGRPPRSQLPPSRASREPVVRSVSPFFDGGEAVSTPELAGLGETPGQSRRQLGREACRSENRRLSLGHAPHPLNFAGSARGRRRPMLEPPASRRLFLANPPLTACFSSHRGGRPGTASPGGPRDP